MKVNGHNYRTVWLEGSSVFLIEQNLLPFEFKIFESKCYQQTCTAIKEMLVRGAGAIGAAAGFALAQAFMQAPENCFHDYVESAKQEIEATRPTAQNLFYATNHVFGAALNSAEPVNAAIKAAQAVADKDAEACRKIGEFGNQLIRDKSRILTHCNAGWLAFVDFGTALSPVYQAHAAGKNPFVYVDETRPRGQGSRLTAWELNNGGVDHIIIPDNAAAHLLSQGKIDLIMVGADRIAANGDTANKIGTLDRAVLAKEFGIPFYIAAPASTFDLSCKTGQEIIIEKRPQEEVLFQEGITESGRRERIKICSPGSPAYNPAFDVTPARYITGFVTELGIIDPQEKKVSSFLQTEIIN